MKLKVGVDAAGGFGGGAAGGDAAGGGAAGGGAGGGGAATDGGGIQLMMFSIFLFWKCFTYILWVPSNKNECSVA